jgi:hypothetical protein
MAENALADRVEAAFTRRVDRLARQVQRLERNSGPSTEALALFRSLVAGELLGLPEIFSVIFACCRKFKSKPTMIVSTQCLGS